MDVDAILNSTYGVCPDCEGAGFIAKLYPSGHTEATCEECDGRGFEEQDELDDLRQSVFNFELR